jgi:hypothetical protein
MVELRVTVSDELAEELVRRAREQQTTAEQLASRAVESAYGTTEQQLPRKLGFIGLGRSGRSDISVRHEEIIRADFGS